jgi:hypothetical protein
LSQEDRPIAYFNEKLNEVKVKYSTYDKEFYAIIQALKKWRHYLIPEEFVLYSDNHALQFVTQQEKLNQRHVKWVEYMQNFSFVIKHISGTANKVVDALSRKCLLLQELRVKTLGFDDLRNMYADDQDFKEAYEETENPILRDRIQWKKYMIQEGLLFKGNQLCIPKCSMRENLLKEKHSGGLAGHFGHDKTFAKLNESYFGRECEQTSRDSWTDVEFVSIQREEDRMRDFINHYQYLKGCGMKSAWISYWGFQEHKEVLTQYLWWWIDFPRWHTSSHVRRPVMQLTLRICFSKNLFDFTACQRA